MMTKVIEKYPYHTPNKVLTPALSNIRFNGKNWPCKVFNRAHWMTLENVKEKIKFGLLIAF